MLKKACWLIDKLNVYPENMAANLEKSYGLVYSQRVLLALVEAGILRDDAYKIVQRSAMRAWEQKTSFKELLRADDEVTAKSPPRSSNPCSTRATSFGTWVSSSIGFKPWNGSHPGFSRFLKDESRPPGIVLQGGLDRIVPDCFQRISWLTELTNPRRRSRRNLL